MPKTDVNLQGERAARDLRGSEKFERRQGRQLKAEGEEQMEREEEEDNL